jgi:hypothetical protein
MEYKEREREREVKGQQNGEARLYKRGYINIKGGV